MDELLLGLAVVDDYSAGVFSGGNRVDRHRQLEVLRDVWPNELEDLCQHVELLKFLVWVCEGSSSCSPTTGREL